MISPHRVTDFLTDLQSLDRAALPAEAGRILETFRRHTPFDVGALYLREGRQASLRLAAKSQHCVAPEILTSDTPSMEPAAQLMLPLKAQREQFGLLALSSRSAESVGEEDLALARAAGELLSTIMLNHRLLQETREGDFQLKYRLWELESLYDIGLSIAATLNIEELADEILFRMISLTNARRAALFLREGDAFKLYRSFGEVRSEFLDSELADRIIREGTPLSFVEGNDCIFPACSAFVSVPIKGNSNSVVGVLAAADRESRDGGIGAFESNELRLLSLFATQAAVALENARLHRAALEKQAMERELELAATIQRDILPKAIPKAARVDIAALSRPARQVGGDYHAFFQRDGVMSMLVADVAGKSMPAALLVSALHAVLQLLFAEGRGLGEIATELNRHIHSWSAENKFITLIMASIDQERQWLEFVNAGHNPAYVMSGGELHTLKSHGLPIGILPGTQYVSQKRPFADGSCLILYSDGITEAENLAGEEYGNEALEAVLRAHLQAAPSELRDRIAEDVGRFVGEAPQKDDQTLVIARTESPLT